MAAQSDNVTGHQVGYAEQIADAMEDEVDASAGGDERGGGSQLRILKVLRLLRCAGPARAIDFPARAMRYLSHTCDALGFFGTVFRELV
jgi:hypothetical protein